MNKYGKDKAQEYMRKSGEACQRHLLDHNGLYFGREGHLRFAREFGYGLNDFNEQGQKEILSGSYSATYVRACNLKPILDAREWQKEMLKQLK